MSYKFDNIISKLKNSDVWYILGHENPDGDSIGTTLAFYNFAKRIGKKAVVISKNTPSETYAFLPNFNEIIVSPICHVSEDNAILLICDTANMARSSQNIEDLLKTTKSIALDHHASNENFADENVINSTASATAEIAYELIDSFGMGITKEEAICLYTAIVTDCGNFAYSCTTARTHEIASRLLSCGVEPALVNEALNKNMTHNMFFAWGLALIHTEIICDGIVAISHLSSKDFESSGASPKDLENLPAFIMRLKGVKIGLFVTEREDGVKFSVRSCEPYDSCKIASYFGGGGHACAAGATLNYKFDEAIKRIEETVKDYANRRNPSNI